MDSVSPLLGPHNNEGHADMVMSRFVSSSLFVVDLFICVRRAFS